MAAAGLPLQATFPIVDPAGLHQILADALALEPDLLVFVFGGGEAA